MPHDVAIKSVAGIAKYSILDSLYFFALFKSSIERIFPNRNKDIPITWGPIAGIGCAPKSSTLNHLRNSTIFLISGTSPVVE